MSWRIANTCAERKFGSATRKQIIMFLADKASDDGSGIWCSKGTFQRHTELGETTVKRTVREFLKEGILVETGARTCKNGFTVVYRIDLTKVEALEPTLEPEIETVSTVAPVQLGGAARRGGLSHRAGGVAGVAIGDVGSGGACRLQPRTGGGPDDRDRHDPDRAAATAR